MIESAPLPTVGALSPPLKWAGGKRWLLEHMLRLWTPERDRRLVEPFVGGLAIVLGLAPQCALLNDLNRHLIWFYRWLQRGLNMRKFHNVFKNDRGVFEKNRDRFNELIKSGRWKSREAAALFYYLNRTCFNGLCRFNADGFFNVPFGQYKKIAYRADFEPYRRALEPYEFMSEDFEELEVQPHDFIYADPPYDVEFTTYSAGGFAWADQERLARWLSRHSGPVVASNQATPRILRLYGNLGFTVRRLSAPRRISCDGNRDDALEMLAWRNLKHQPRLSNAGNPKTLRLL